MSKILYVGKFVPNKGAAGIHVHNIVRCLREQGIDICYLALRERDTTDKYGKVYVGSVPSNRFKRFLNLIDIITGHYEYRAFKQVIAVEHPDVVVLYNRTNAFTQKVIKFCKTNGIKIIIENTEWYSLSPLNAGLADYLMTRSVDKRIRKTDKLADGVIAISSYLYQYYKEIGVRVLNLPPLFSFNTINKRTELPCDSIKFVYAGSPGGKDILKPFVKCISELVSSTGIKTEFHIYGINSTQLAHIMEDKTDYSLSGVYAHGRVSHEEVIESVSQSHYTILLRYPERYAKAGYSTKVAESLALGTPVICNRIGGTDGDIIDGETGFVIPDCSDDSLKRIIQKVCSITEEDYSSMRRQSINYANTRYATDTHKQNIINFIFEQ